MKTDNLAHAVVLITIVFLYFWLDFKLFLIVGGVIFFGYLSYTMNDNKKSDK